MIVVEDSKWTRPRSRLGRQSFEKVLDCPVEGRRLMQVGGVPGVGDRHLRRIRDLARHVIGGREKMRVVGADQYQGRHSDLVEPGDDAVIGLRQHAARRTGEAARRAMLAGANLVARAKGRDAACFEVAGALLRPLVPGPPRLGVAKAGPVSNSISALTMSGWAR